MTQFYNMTEIITYFAGNPPTEATEPILYITACLLALYLIVYMIQVIGFLVGVLKYRMI